jgi:ribosomal protein S11
MAVGLVSLLVTCGLIAFFWGKGCHPADPVIRSQDAREKADRLSGHGIAQSIKLELEGSGRAAAVVVRSIVPGGDMERYYGLAAGDRIVEIVDVGPIDLFDSSAPAMVLQEAARNRKLVVIRNGQKLVLPP